jgi:hypothetical protein
MKTKATETKFESLRIARHLFTRIVCLGTVILICSSAPAQNLFVSGSDAGGVKIFEFTPNGLQSIFASGLNAPNGLAFDGAGNLFVADAGGSILKFTPDGAQTTFALGLADPNGLAFDSAGNLFVADGGSILKFTPNGARSTFASGLDGAWALAFDSAGNLFVTDGIDIVGPGHANIYKFSPDGTRTTFASGLLAPEALAFDSAGNLFVLEGGDIDGLGAAIFKFTPAGKKSTFASPFLCIGPGLAIDSANNLFVPDWCTGNIYKFTPLAKRSTFVSGSGLNENFAYLAFQPTPTTGSGQLRNISTRAFVQTGDNVVIGGVIITGSGQKKVILRAIGSSLVNHGITNPLQNPTLELHDHTGAVIASNDNWLDAPNRQEIINSGLAPSNNLESAILTSLNPGAYTAIVRGVNNGTGIALVEGYDLDPTAGSKLGNISTRAFVQTGDNVVIGGLIISGASSEDVVVRAIGPSLTQYGIANALADPMLELHDGNGALIVSNDNWKDTQQTEIQATGLAPSNDAESAILRTLAPGNYTAIVRGKNNTTGVALVEVYAAAALVGL